MPTESRIKNVTALICAVITTGAMMMPQYSEAAALLHFVESDGNIVATFSGSFDLTNAETQLIFGQSSNEGEEVLWDDTNIKNYSNDGSIGSTSDSQGALQILLELPDGYAGGSSAGDYVVFGTGSFDPGPSPYSLVGSGVTAANSEFSALLHGKFNPSPYITIDPNYVSGDEFSATLTWTGVSFASLGITDPSEFVYSLKKIDPTGSTDTFTVRFGDVSPVPLPASVLLLGAGVSGFGLLSRLRRRKLVG